MQSEEYKTEVLECLLLQEDSDDMSAQNKMLHALSYLIKDNTEFQVLVSSIISKH